MARIVVAFLILAAALAGCTDQVTVHAYHLTRHIVVAGDDTGYDILDGAHCPRLERDGDGFHWDREWMEPTPNTIVYEEWTGPGYERAAHSGSAQDWFRLDEALIQSSLDGARTLIDLGLEDGTLLIDDEPVVLPWNRTFSYTVVQPTGTFQVTETLTLEDEGVRPLSITTHWRLSCA